MLKKLSGLIAVACSMLPVGCFAANPFITSIYTADPSAHVWSDGRLYVYPSHDIDPPVGSNLMDRYHVYSTEDMVNWQDEGEILNSSQVSWSTQPGFMWAPDCAFKNGTYYFYFPHPSTTNWNNTWKVGVATSTQPASGFTSVGYITGLGGHAMIDPSVFVDTDGQAYIYYGGGGVCQGGKLQSNMTALNGAMQSMTGLVDFHEATWVFKRNKIYYLTYADNKASGNRLNYATSSNPLGPWTYKGVYLNPTGSSTSHGSAVEYKGQWYQFYHNKSLSGNDSIRSICVDKLNFNADGTIQMITQTTAGVPSVGPAPVPNPNTVKYEAEIGTVANGATVANDAAASGGKSVQNFHLANSSLQLDTVSGGSGGRATIDIRYAAASNAKIRLTVNGADYSFLNTPASGGWNNYSGRTYLTVPLGIGTANTIKLTGGNGGVNIDYLTVSPFSPSSTGVTFYQNTQYGGTASQTLAKETYTLSQLAAQGVPNDWASSTRIPSGWTVIMYHDDNFAGTSWTLTADTPDFSTLSPSATDQMSSCKIQ
ncbi:MAG: Xylan 1,4-beta-xylosidase [Pedosphaera sp.]|nr:Xylan 1,4-beta-xylosidase [Pedosphaera sp.]